MTPDEDEARGRVHRAGPGVREPEAVRLVLTSLAMAVLGVLVALPLGAVFVHAFAHGARGWLEAVTSPEAAAAIRLTLLTAAVCVPLNTAFGVAAAWLIARYRFPGRQLLLTAIDLPFSVSPVICGLVFVLLFGTRGYFGRFLVAHQIRVIFAVPGIALATAFVTFPFVAREVLSVLEAQGAREEEAALTLGATTLQMLRHVTLPKIKWGLLYGVVLCNARAMGEFGAVSVVSGHIANETNTLPLHVELLASEYNLVGAFAVASLLALLALVTLAVRYALEAQAGEAGVTVVIEGVTKRYARTSAPAVTAASFAAPEGSITALLGPSGSGKTTLLRMIAGLESPDAGVIRIAGQDMAGVPVRLRQLGFVFQSYALFPTMTVRDNVGFGLTIRRTPRADRDARIDELLALVQLSGFGDRLPAELSAGQQQRVAFARALAPRPRLLLLDEPFGALDTQVRLELRAWLRELHRSAAVSTILVTHDHEEAMEVSAHVVLMDHGRVVQCGPPDEILARPATPFVSAFMRRPGSI